MTTSWRYFKKRPQKVEDLKKKRNHSLYTTHSETQVQQAIIIYANLAKFEGGRIIDYLFSNQNGGYRKPREAARLKREGTKAGVSDLFFAWPTEKYHGLWIEVKTESKTSKLSQKQSDWLDLMDSVGYKTAVVRSLDQFKTLLQEYLS